MMNNLNLVADGFLMLRQNVLKLQHDTFSECGLEGDELESRMRQFEDERLDGIVYRAIKRLAESRLAELFAAVDERECERIIQRATQGA